MKVNEMEQALAAMGQQVDDLQGVMKQNVALQVCTTPLPMLLALILLAPIMSPCKASIEMQSYRFVCLCSHFDAHVWQT